MPKKTLHALVGSDRLRVETTWLSGATLFMNDQPIARNNGLFSASSQTPLLSAEATVNGSKSQIEVFVRAIFTVKIQIRLNGTIVAGEEL